MVEHTLDETNSDNGKNRVQIAAIIVGCLPALSTGLLFAWPSPFITKISNDKINYDITEEEASYFTVLPHIMILLFCPIVSKICDIIGRKHTIMLAILPQAAAFALTAFGKTLYIFYLSRCVCGIGDSIVFTAIPMYIGEISTPTVRGTWGNVFVFYVTAGIFSMNVLGMYFSVAEVSYICLSVMIVFIVLFPTIPESPFFYLMKNRDTEAQHALKILRCKDDVDMEFFVLEKDVKRQMSETGTWKDLFMIESNRKALLGGVFIRISQQFSGMSAFIMYTKFIFDKSGNNIDANMSTIFYTGLNWALIFFGSLFVDRLGRKKSYIFSLAIANISLVGISIYFYIEQFEPQVDIGYLKWFPLACMIWFTLFSSFGILIVPSLIVSEIFSASIKAKGLTATVIALGFSTALTGYFFYNLNVNYGLYSPFLFFVVCNIISIFLTMYVIPETKGKSLEEIQQHLKGNRT